MWHCAMPGVSLEVAIPWLSFMDLLVQDGN